MRLYSNAYSYHSRRCIAVLRHLELEVEVREVNLGEGEHHSSEFAALNPNRKVPVLVDGDLTLWESIAIVHYLSDQRPGVLVPETASGRADVLRWQNWTVTRFNSATAVFLHENMVKAFFGLGPPDTARVEATTPEIIACFDLLEAQLSGQDFLCGEDVSLADFTLYPTFEHGEVIGLPSTDGHPALRQWCERMAALPAFR